MLTLESLPLFRDLRPEERAAVRTVARERRFEAGQDIFREGDPGDGVYIVQSGQVEISGQLAPGQRRVFSRLGPGEIFGEMAILEHRPRSATATARIETTAWYLPRGELLTLVERSPGLALSLLQEMSRRLREFNRQYLREVLQAERLAVVGRFARSIVHDLKNPLNIIGLTADLVGMPDAPPALRTQARERIRKQVERITEMLNEILEFTQGPEAGMNLEHRDYADYVRGLLEELRPDLELKSVRIELAGEPPSVTVRLDPRRLQRVFTNLLHNAADAMPQGGCVTFRFRRQSGQVVTEIEDTGPGVSPEIADRLFEPFATHGKAHGTGLGLSICKKIIEDHGGRIWLRQSPGRGATFIFTLPEVAASATSGA